MTVLLRFPATQADTPVGRQAGSAEASAASAPPTYPLEPRDARQGSLKETIDP